MPKSAMKEDGRHDHPQTFLSHIAGSWNWCNRAGEEPGACHRPGWISERGLPCHTQLAGAGVCRSKVTNTGAAPVKLREIILFEAPHDYLPETKFYGEGFTMLSQTGGTLAKPVPIGGYLDRKHYRIPERTTPSLPIAPHASRLRRTGMN